MKLDNATLFLIPALIWGSTFYVIKFQLGAADSTWSVSYRFILSGILLLAYSRLRQLNLKFSLKDHGRIILQGVLLFGLNYWLVYFSEEKLTSALVAVTFSTIIFLNIFFGSLFLRKKTNMRVFVGAFIGIGGTFLLFQNNLIGITRENLSILHLLACFTSVVIASLGNIMSAYNQSKSLPVIQSNGFGMLYGGIVMGIIAWSLGKPMVYDLTTRYITSLLYLSIFGSIIAFSSYLTLIGRIGADRAAYVLIIIPLIAVCLSIFFENYPLSWQVVLGIILLLGGNIIVLRKKSFNTVV